MGVNIAVIVYDDVEAISAFELKYDIAYTMLSDEQSMVIRQFGLLNPSYEPDTKYYGVPYPGIFLIDGNGVIRDKFSEENYRDRPSIEDLINSAKRLSGTE